MRTLPNERLSAPKRADGPERKCILSGEHEARDNLVRLAISPEGQVLPDVHARAPGRGAWIGVSREELEKAIAKGNLRGALARAFKGAPIAVPDDLPQQIDDALVRALTQRLGLEVKSGRLLMGSDRIAQQARMGRVAWIGHAADASADGSAKLDQALRVGLDEEGSGRTGTTLPLDRAALSVALGRDNVVHLALADAAAAERVTTLIARLQRFRGQTEAHGTEGEQQVAGDTAPLGTTMLDSHRAQAN